jgi:membrane-bound lytic murein transglycosylase D
MGFLIKTNRLWLLLMVMLAAAAVTDRLVKSSVPVMQFGQSSSQNILSAEELEVYRSYISPDINRAYTSQPEIETTTNDALSAPDIWTRIRSGFVFPEVDPDLLQTCIDEYRKHPLLLKQILQRGEPYLFHIVDRLEQDGMPVELALLPVIESAFDPFATSPAGAAGIWQFMPETAAYVGLDLDWWYDGRRDIIASTDAALHYLKQLHKRFDNDWLLALAAYNAGSARVKRSLRENRNAGKPDDFWQLSLPAETRAYVPRLLALRAIIKNPHDYNISLPRLSDTRYFSTVEIRGQIELKVAAELAEVPLSTLRQLNPGYDRSITPPDRTHTLLFPSSVASVFRERIAQLPKNMRVRSIRHKIRKGDNLSTIAQHYRTTVPALRKLNRLKGNKIIAGEFLMVPANERDASISDVT